MNLICLNGRSLLNVIEVYDYLVILINLKLKWINLIDVILEFKFVLFVI